MATASYRDNSTAAAGAMAATDTVAPLLFNDLVKREMSANARGLAAAFNSVGNHLEHLNKQTTNSILMVRPANFGFNPETGTTNHFQANDRTLDEDLIREYAMQEFDAFVQRLREAGLNVVVLKDTRKPIKPCAVFPDWITTFSDGTIILSSFLARSRRFERRRDLVSKITADFDVNDVVGLDHLEEEGAFIEGKGSMVLDRTNKLLYACISARTHPKAVHTVCDLMGYQPILFRATDDQGREIYHTDVLLAMGDTFVVICWEAVREKAEREMLTDSFEQTGKEIVEITMDQLKHFAGNILVAENDQGEKLLIMSEQAFRIFRRDQLLTFRRHVAEIVYSPIDTIEKFGGGSAHCVTTEIFLPKREEANEDVFNDPASSCLGVVGAAGNDSFFSGRFDV